MANSDPRFIYFIDTDNVLCELEAEEFSPTSGLSAIAVANEYCEAYNFRLYTIEEERWEDSDWERGYAELENGHGLFTPERRAHLFDL